MNGEGRKTHVTSLFRSQKCHTSGLGLVVSRCLTYLAGGGARAGEERGRRWEAGGREEAGWPAGRLIGWPAV